MKRIVILAMMCAAWPALAGVIQGKVIEVPDGGTLTILSKEGASIHRVRLAGIDAPGKNRAIGGSSRESLMRMARGKLVRVETASIDGRGLLVGIVLIERTQKDCGTQPCAPLFDPGIAQLTSGMAKVDKSNVGFHSPESQKLYAEAQSKAKAQRLGIWRESSPSNATHDGPAAPLR